MLPFGLFLPASGTQSGGSTSGDALPDGALTDDATGLALTDDATQTTLVKG